jgi:hypothetical protein
LQHGAQADVIVHPLFSDRDTGPLAAALTLVAAA